MAATDEIPCPTSRVYLSCALLFYNMPDFPYIVKAVQDL